MHNAWQTRKTKFTLKLARSYTNINKLYYDYYQLSRSHLHNMERGEALKIFHYFIKIQPSDQTYRFVDNIDNIKEEKATEDMTGNLAFTHRIKMGGIFWIISLTIFR